MYPLKQTVCQDISGETFFAASHTETSALLDGGVHERVREHRGGYGNESGQKAVFVQGTVMYCLHISVIQSVSSVFILTGHRQ